MIPQLRTITAILFATLIFLIGNGLLGTLIGIIGVLKDLSNPESVGPAMGVATAYHLRRSTTAPTSTF